MVTEGEEEEEEEKKTRETSGATNHVKSVPTGGGPTCKSKPDGRQGRQTGDIGSHQSCKIGPDGGRAKLQVQTRRETRETDGRHREPPIM